MTDDAKTFDVQSAIVTMLAVKFLELQDKGVYTFTQQELKEMLSTVTLRIELDTPRDPATSDITCSKITLEDAQRFVQQMKKVVDRTKKKS